MKPVKTEVNNAKKYVFFVSHSTKDTISDINGICDILETCKIAKFVADKDAPIGESLPSIVKEAIEESELVLVILTKNSKYSPWVNQEIGYALGKDIPVIPLKKGRIIIKGLIESAKYIPMKDDPLDTVKEVFSRLGNTNLSKTAEAAIGAVVGTLELIERHKGIS